MFGEMLYTNFTSPILGLYAGLCDICMLYSCAIFFNDFFLLFLLAEHEKKEKESISDILMQSLVDIHLTCLIIVSWMQKLPPEIY